MKIKKTELEKALEHVHTPIPILRKRKGVGMNTICALAEEYRKLYLAVCGARREE